MNEQLDRIRKAYDLTVEHYWKGIRADNDVPIEIKNLPGYEDVINNPLTRSNAPDIKAYLEPGHGMRYLDAGCSANLANYRLDKWPCIYYGVDISPALIDAMKSFVKRNNISIGGLYVTDITNLPFEDNFLDIASVIGVFEYYILEYIEHALKELNRVLKSNAKMVVDIPNMSHPYVHTMFKLEEYLGRPNILKDRKMFEDLLRPLFKIERIDDSQVTLKYFIRTIK